jgi:hypothetical protein
MKPDTANSAFAALAHQLGCHARVGGYYDSVDRPWNGREIRVTPRAFDLRCLWIDWKGFVPGVTQFAVNGIGCLSRFSRHTRYGDALPAEECGDGFGYIDH